MRFKEGEETDRECPTCGKPLIFEMSFSDRWSYNPKNEGHYTVDRPMEVCSDDKCDYYEDYEPDELEE